MQIVTALFDIGREKDDGRTMDDYLSWLHSLLEIFPKSLVFHDGSADRLISSFCDVRFIDISIQDLHFFTHIDHITTICDQYLASGKKDLVYRNPLYGIVTMSKFELMLRALAYSADQQFLWVDAGVLRLYKQYSEWSYDDFKNIDSNNLNGALVEIDVLPRCGRLWPKIPSIGSSDRLVGTSIMLVERQTVISLHRGITELVQNWIHQDQWDTEQVAIARIWKLGFPLSFCVQQRRTPTSILRALRDNCSNLRSFPFLPSESLITRIVRWIIL